MAQRGSWKQTLVRYATDPHPENLDPKKIRLRITKKTLTIWDAYPKAKYHFLLLPRPHGDWTERKLLSLRNMLKDSKREDALELLEIMREESQEVVKMIEDEMVSRSVPGTKASALILTLT